jgi:hypothetical protein
MLWTAAASAQSAHVANRCPRLSAAEYEELDARVLLLLKSEEESRPAGLPAVVCSDRGSWVEWDGQRFEIVGRGSIPDEVVDIVEAELNGSERRTEVVAKTIEDEAVAAGEPVLDGGSGPAPSRRRAAVARGGGLTVGIESELPSEHMALCSGPAFDFGTSFGPLILGGREAFRFAVSSRQVTFMDFEAAVAYGAPLDPHTPFGAVVRFGAEWMVAYPEGTTQAAVVPVLDLGVRAAQNFGLVSAWVGVDAHFRLDTLTLRSDDPLVASTVGGSLTLGVAFVDWSRK